MKPTADICSGVLGESLLAALRVCPFGDFQGLNLHLGNWGEKHDYYSQMSRHQKKTCILRVLQLSIKIANGPHVK